ncbi:ATPase expression protein 3 [Candida viswanathii]|uniref:ATPase expression protein 3 n=1 Tax=Candida viswanathii TaxID=5486 RepID=A0A367YEP7_9ASCO|nr:ATPase expression protein 3 [Candida viswanathii]
MIALKDTILRISRAVRQSKDLPKTTSSTRQESPREPRTHKPEPTPTIIEKRHEHLPNEKLQQFKPLYSDFQRKVFLDFLRPLNMPNLKTLNKRPPYDSARARSNWRQKSSSAPQDILDTYLKRKRLFKRLIWYLKATTPARCKNVDYSNTDLVQNLLEQDAEMSNYSRKWEMPHQIFHEIPPMPSPLTKENFEEYIYKLTHATYHYKNSLSLQSGIIPQILLHTHKLSNKEFKPFRSTTTFNHLIKYFGCDKGQDLFARELVLAMTKDGHELNRGTISNLFRILKNRSKIRSVRDTYRLTLFLARFADRHSITTNLLTWAKVYDVIDNVYLKEWFLNEMQENGIPFVRLLLDSILRDFARSTKNTEDLIYFIENDLGIKNWRTDAAARGAVIRHSTLYSSVDVPEYVGSEFDFKNWLLGIKYRRDFEGRRSIHMLKNFFVRDFDISETLPNFSMPIEQLIEDFPDVRHQKQLVFVVRGLIYEATKELGLPLERNTYDNGNQSIPENYKIVLRDLNDALQELVARVEFLNKNSLEKCPAPWEWLSNEEVEQWEGWKQSFKANPDGMFPQFEDFQPFPQEEMEKTKTHIMKKMVAARNRERLRVVNEGFDGHMLSLMKERGLIQER